MPVLTPAFARLRAPLVSSLALAMTISGSGIAFSQAPQPAQPRPAQPRPAQPAQQPAQPAAPTGPTIVQVKAEPSQAEWTKVCGKDPGNNKEICYTTRDFVSDQGQPVLAVAIYDVKGDSQRIARFLMPLGLLLSPGIRFGMEQSQPIAGRYQICFPNGCFAEAQIGESVLNGFKKGGTLNVSVQNQVAREVTFAIPMAGFGKAFDGAAIDPKILEEQQRQLQDELQKRSEEMRKKLEAPAAVTPGAPAVTAPKP
jgi:invasion protein IalB